MAPKKRGLPRVELPNGAAKKDRPAAETERLVDQLMGRKPELRLAFIQDNSKLVKEIDV